MAARSSSIAWAVPVEPEQQLEPFLGQAVPELVSRSTTGRGEGHVLDAARAPDHATAPSACSTVSSASHGRWSPPAPGPGLPGAATSSASTSAASTASRRPSAPASSSLAGALGPDPLDERVERTGGRNQRAPQPGGHGVGRDGLAGSQREQGDQGALALARGGSVGRRRRRPAPCRAVSTRTHDRVEAPAVEPARTQSLFTHLDPNLRATRSSSSEASTSPVSPRRYAARPSTNT